MFAPNGMFSGVDHNFYEEDAPENMTPISIAKIEISLMENSACVYRKTKSSLTIGRSGGVSEMRLCGACVWDQIYYRWNITWNMWSKISTIGNMLP